jgi:hypothetical protein
MRLTFDLELLRFFAAWADPEKPGAMAGANALGSAAGATRNAAARNATRRLRDIISSQAGMKTIVPYHGCSLASHSKPGSGLNYDSRDEFKRLKIDNGNALDDFFEAHLYRRHGHSSCHSSLHSGRYAFA